MYAEVSSNFPASAFACAFGTVSDLVHDVLASRLQSLRSGRVAVSPIPRVEEIRRPPSTSRWPEAPTPAPSQSGTSVRPGRVAERIPRPRPAHHPLRSTGATPRWSARAGQCGGAPAHCTATCAAPASRPGRFRGRCDHGLIANFDERIGRGAHGGQIGRQHLRRGRNRHTELREPVRRVGTDEFLQRRVEWLGHGREFTASPTANRPPNSRGRAFASRRGNGKAHLRCRSQRLAAASARMGTAVEGSFHRRMPLSSVPPPRP